MEHGRKRVGGFTPFEIVAGEVEVFPATDVIYIGIQQGERELREMYSAISREPLAFKELYPYHPHITLAQDLSPDQVQPLTDLARKRWAAFPHPRRMHAERTCLVQSRDACRWEDLAEFRLAGVQVG
jgi:2'-5' RNA ligase